MLRRVEVAILSVVACLYGFPASAQQAGGYDAATRPDPPGVATPVSLGVFVLDIAAIDDRAQEFEADVFASLKWQDRRLANPDAAVATRLFPIAEVWHPAITVVNRRGGDLLLPELVRVDAEGNVTYEQRFLGEFASPLDLRRFPGDEQVLGVELTSYRYGKDEVDFTIETGRIGRSESFTIAGWVVGELEVVAAGIEALAGVRAGAEVQLRARRETGYYLLTMVLPLVLISLMAWTVFWIDPTLLPPQVSVATASVFSLIAFRFSLSAQLPRVSYLTTADWFVLNITLLVFGALGVTIVSGRFARRERVELARRIDAVSRWVYLAAVVLVLVWALR